MNLYSIETGYFKLDGGAMFGVVPKVIWNNINPADDKNLCRWAMRCLLIEDGDKLILIDNGIGNKQDEKFFKHYYLHGDENLEGSLNKNGFTKDDVTDVFLTHLHFDHCGGSITREGEKLIPAFKNAKYWSNKQHWNWATQPNDREKASFLKENILPIQESGQLNFLAVPQNVKENELGSVPFNDNMSILFVNGHTQGMMLPVIKHNNKTIVYMADLLPSSGHIPLPYVMAYDMFPLTTLIEKKLFLSKAVQEEYFLFFEHDPVTELCTLTETEKGIRPKENLKLSEIL